MAVNHKMIGSKTSIGLVRSARNSRKHGLNSSDIFTEQEKNIFDPYYKELVKENKLTPVLELTQAHRLATAHAKRQMAYVYEKQLVERQAIKVKKDIVMHMHEYFFVEPVVRGMLQELFRFDQLGLPCGLNHVILKQICQEFAECTAPLSDEAAYQDHLPTLSRFLNGYSFTQTHDFLYDKLKAMSFILQAAIDRGDNYSEYTRQFFEKLMPQSKELDEPDPGLEELMAYVRASQEKMRVSRENYAFRNERVPEYPNAEQVATWMKPFLTLWDAYQAAYAFQPKLQTLINDRLSYISLSAADEERVRKYQQRWEKQYSDAMTELIALLRERERYLHA